METMASALAIVEAGTEAAREAITAGVQAGSVTIAVALPVQPGSVATIVDDRLSGVQHFVDYGQSCSHHLVQVGGGDAAQLYVVDANAPGVTCQPLKNIGQRPQATVTYDNAPAIPAGDAACIARLVQFGTVLCSVQLLGCAQVALDLAVGYVADRVQFGRPLGTFQAVQHHCADMATAVEASRYLVYEAAWKVERGEASAEDLAIARAIATRSGVFVTLQAHQLHGGIGVTDEYPLQIYSRHAKERSVAWMSEHEALTEAAKHVEAQTAWV
jgi:alkylation response protein AidB-like acyl-CoA dehydrogenase